MRYLPGIIFLAALFVTGFAPTMVQAAPIAPGAFSTTWNTNNSGVSPSNQIQFRLGGGGDTCSGTIYWEEVGNDTNNGTSTLDSGCALETLTFPSPGIYRVDILGTHPRFYPQYTIFPTNYDGRKLLSVEQWGSNVWSNMADMFRRSENLVFNASDTPILSNVTSMNAMFEGATNFNEPLNSWDVSNVTSMNAMFAAAYAFNQPLDSWNVSNVTNMSEMFSFTNVFNQDISSWNVSSVTDMNAMFREALAFNQPLNTWNVSNVTSMVHMFWNADAFNQPLNNWDVSSVTNFGEDSGPYDTGMFAETDVFNQPLDNWDMSSASNTMGMFKGAKAFNQPLNTWNVSNVRNMRAMFAETDVFNQPLDNWNVSNVFLMWDMFNGAKAFNQSLGAWNVSNVTSMDGMFNNSALLPVNYSSTLVGWAGQSLRSNVSLGATNMRYASTATTARQTLTTTYNWSISGDGPFVQPPNHVFVTQWDTRLDAATQNQLRFFVPGSHSYNFFIDWGDGTTRYYGADPGGVYIAHTYSSPGIKTVTITGSFPAFYPGCEAGPENNKLVDVLAWGTGTWSVLVVPGCSHLIDFSATDIPVLSPGISFWGAFQDASQFNGDISSWDVSNVTNMQSMFQGATDFNQPLNNWDVSNVTNMQGMFYGATDFNQPLNNWDVSSVVRFGTDVPGDGMFRDATAFNQPLNNWQTASATRMGEMFYGATAFNQSLGSWDVTSVTDMTNMLTGSGLSSENYSDTLVGWGGQTVQPNVQLDATGIAYLANATSSRQILTDTYSWTINDSGLYTEPVQNRFVTVWDTSRDAGSANQLRLYLDGGSTASFFLDWGDGVVQYFGSMPSGDISHTYATSGIKTVTITGTFPYFYPACDSGPEYDKLIDVLDWGTLPWDYFGFYECSYLDDFSATNTPNLSVMTDMSYMFYGTPFNDDISDWDVSNITNMAEMFRQANNFSQDLSSWDISNVTNTDNMFRNTALSTTNYTKILLSWSLLTPRDSAGLGTVGMTGSETPYCSSAQSAWDTLTTTYNWYFTDGGQVNCKTITYLVSSNGTLSGDSFQYIEEGEEGTAVTVVPAAGYRFVRWSDGSTLNPRTDENLTTDVVVTAIIEAEGNRLTRFGTKVGVRLERLREMALNAPVVASIKNFVSSLQDFIDFLTTNETELETLTPEERTKVIVALRDIIAFILLFIPGV